PRIMTRSRRPSALTLSTTRLAASLEETFTIPSEPDHLVPELLLLRGDLIHPDVLRLQVLLQAPRTVLAADPGLLVPAERRDRGHQVVVVHPHGAGPDALRHLEGAGDVTRPHRAAQAVDGVVGHPNGILHGLVSDHRQDRPEDLLLRDLHRVVDLAEDGGFVEVPGVQAIAGHAVAS